MSEDADLPLPWEPPQPTPFASFCMDPPEASLHRTSQSSALSHLSDVNRQADVHRDFSEFLQKKKSTYPATVYQRLINDSLSRRLLHRRSTPLITPQQPRMSRSDTAALLSRLESDARRRKEERQRAQEKQEEEKIQEALRLANMHHSRNPDRLVQSRLEAWQHPSIDKRSVHSLAPVSQGSELSFQPVFTRYASKVSQRHGQSSVKRMLDEAERAVLNLSPHNSCELEAIDDLLERLQAPPDSQRPPAPLRTVRSSGSEVTRRKQADCITHPPKLAPRLALQRARTQFGHLITSDTG